MDTDITTRQHRVAKAALLGLVALAIVLAVWVIAVPPPGGGLDGRGLLAILIGLTAMAVVALRGALADG